MFDDSTDDSDPSAHDGAPTEAAIDAAADEREALLDFAWAVRPLRGAL